MSIAKQIEKQRRRQLDDARHHALSAIANAEERICILIDEDEQDEAKEEVVALIAAVKRWLESV